MKRAPNQPNSKLMIYAGIFLKTWSVADAGTVIPQHSHEHPHITFLVQGAVRVWAGDGPFGTDFAAPDALQIPAHTPHKFLTLTDNVVFACIHAVGEADDVAIAAEHALDLED
jgi:quercetin dioxygenase-like cupin family protein